MKITHLITLAASDASSGGVQRVAIEQLAALRQRGHEVLLVGGWRGDGPPSDLDGVPFRGFPVRSPRGKADLRLLTNLRIKSHVERLVMPADVIHVHACRDLVTSIAMHQFRRAGVRFVAQCHGMIGPPTSLTQRAWDWAWTRNGILAAHRVIALSEIEQQTMETYGVSKDSIFRLPNSVSVPEKASWKGADSPYLLFAARLEARKQPDVAVRVLHRLRHAWPGRLVIAGPDEGEFNALRSLICELDIEDRVDVVGALPHNEIQSLMKHARALLLPSRTEPYPMTVLEAMAIGLPVIMTTESGLAKDLATSRAALLSEPTVEGFSSALLELLSNASLAAQTSTNAFSTAKSLFNASSKASILENLYREVVVQ